LITERWLAESCRQSVMVVKHKFKVVVGLRLGYFILCWVIGVTAYIGAILFFVAFPNLVLRGNEEIYGRIYTVYFWIGLLIIIAVAILQLFLRLIYVIASCDIYSDYLEEKQEKAMFPEHLQKAPVLLLLFLWRPLFY